MRQIELTQGKVALVDDADFDAVTAHRWCFSHGYAVRAVGPRGQQKRIYMHRSLCSGIEVDHIDGNKLNNQRGNLRIVSRGENTQNKPARGITGLKGVTPVGASFLAQISYGKKHFYLGRHKTAKQAACAYDAKALDLYGPHARLNFP